MKYMMSLIVVFLGALESVLMAAPRTDLKGDPLPLMPEDVPFQPISIYGMIEGLVNGPYIRVAQLYAELGDKDSMEALMCEAWEFLRNDEEMIRGSSCAFHRQCRVSSSNPRRTCYSAFSFLVWLN